MSLIIDGLKMAQQLRLKRLNEAPFFAEGSSRIEKGKARRKNILIFASAGVGSLLLLSFGGSNLWPVFKSHQGPRIAAMEEKKSSIPTGMQRESVEPVQKKEPRIRQKASHTPARDSHSKSRGGESPLPEEPFPYGKIHRPLNTGGEKALPSMPFFVEEKREESSMKSLADASKVMKVGSAPETMPGKVETPLLSDPRKEERGEPSLKSLADASKVMKLEPSPKSATTKGEMPVPPDSRKGEAAYDGPIEVKPAAEKDPNLPADVLTHFNLGIHFYQQKEILKAIQSYQKVMELDPNYVEAYNNLGIIYQEMGDLEKALEAYQKSIEINPRYEKAYNNRGIVFYLQGRDEEALESFQKALALNPNNIESYINMGILFRNKGQAGKAIESYQKALAINPLHGETHYNIGLLYEQIENFDWAIRHYHKFVQLCSKTHPDLTSKMQRRLDYLLVTKGTKRK
jgi:Tfp pilus assembly protein PilF